jgi:glycosyl transferase family 25
MTGVAGSTSYHATPKRPGGVQISKRHPDFSSTFALAPVRQLRYSGRAVQTPVAPPVYVISLDRTAGRYASFLARNSHLGEIARARAVDGDTLDRADLCARGLLQPDTAYSNGALGCALSHACIWQVVAGSKGPWTIAEDDAIFRADFHDAAARVVASLPPDWDFVLWGWNFNSILCIDLLPGITPCALIADQAQLRQNIAGFQESRVPAIPVKLLRSHGAPAYSVSPAGARKLLRLCLPIRPVDVFFPVVNRMAPSDGIDMMMSLAYPRMQAYVSFPPLAVTENRRDRSTIQGRE